MWAGSREAIVKNRAVKALLLLYENLDRSQGLIAAGAMAFDAFLSLVPLAAFAGYILHLLHQSGEIFINPIVRTAPGPVADIVDSAVDRLSEGSGAVIAPVSVVAFLWTTSSGLSTAMYVFETAFFSRPRPWYVRRLIAIACVVASLAVLALVTAAAVGAAMISSWLARVVAVTLPTAVGIGMLSAFFRIAVRRDRIFGRRRVLPGVLVTVVLWSIVSALFSFYVSTLSRYATLYGGLAAVAIFLLWLWLLALALLVGGEVNAQLDGVRALPAGATPLGPLSGARDMIK